MKTLYILLTRVPTAASRVIRLATGDAYTHVALAWDPALSTLCSFARRYWRFPIPAGLVQEDVRAGNYIRHANIPCALLALPVSDRVYDAVCRRAAAMLAERRRYRYDYAGLISCRLGIRRQKAYAYFCSQFVADLLQQSGAVRLPKPPSLMRPQEFLTLPEVTCLYRGTIAELNRRLACGLPPKPTHAC